MFIFIMVMGMLLSIMRVRFSIVMLMSVFLDVQAIAMRNKVVNNAYKNFMIEKFKVYN